jgi:hypothetical protein
MTIFSEKALWKRLDTLWGVSLIAGGLLVNYVLEHRTFLKPGMLSPRAYLGAWPDIFLPSLAFFLAVSGVILFAIGVKRSVLPGTGQWRFWPAFLIAIPLAILYGVFYFGMQFIATGADRFGECPGLDEAANASHEIPESLLVPGEPAVGCAVERYGMFLSYYNDLAVFGVTDRAAQERVLRNLSDYQKEFHTSPIHVGFYEKQNLMPLQVDKQGKGWGWRSGPEKLIRVVTLR